MLIRKERPCLAPDFSAEGSGLGRGLEHTLRGVLQFSGLQSCFSFPDFASGSRKQPQDCGASVAPSLCHLVFFQRSMPGVLG